MFKKILVPIDGSECAGKALDYALVLAEKFCASIEILHVVPPIPLRLLPYVGEAMTTPPLWMGTYVKETKTMSEKMLSEALEKSLIAKPDLTISTKLVEGREGDQIVKRAKDGSFDLIVIGSRGLGGIREFFLGSVSDWVADNAECPVMIVK